MAVQKGLIPRSGGPQDNFLYWSVQIMAILKAKLVWHVVRADDAVSSFSSLQLRASVNGSNVASDFEYVRDLTSSIILHVLGKVPFACFML